jgi:predicted RNA-binding Zn-ribbon protein involved in translation (DUF1610 family)
MVTIVVVIIIVVLCVVVLRFSKSTKTKGKKGVLLVELNLGRNIPNEKYIINNLLFYNDGKSHQIDHIIICKKGIFVVETKNYSGQIYGQDNQREWTQVLAYGRKKHQFYNPILQNKSHIYSLSKIIGRKDCFISIIVFPKAEIMTDFDAYVGSISDMKRWIKQDREEILTTAEIERIYRQLIEYKNNPQLTYEQHIDNIYNLQQRIENNICPRCGNKLVLRKGKSGSFYGCSAYPNCKFIKKLK